jgi:hypothetical protein
MRRRKNERLELFSRSDIRIPATVDFWNGFDAAIEFSMYAEDFHAAARTLTRELLRRDDFKRGGMSTRSSFRAYPAFYLYRHSLELALKGVVVAGSDLLEYRGEPVDLPSIYRTHRLGGILPVVERVFDAVGWNWDLGIDGCRTLEGFRSLIEEVDEMDSRSALWRYPVRGDGEASMRSQSSVNLIRFTTTMDQLLEMLCDAPAYVTVEVDRYFACV